MEKEITWQHRNQKHANIQAGTLGQFPRTQEA